MDGGELCSQNTLFPLFLNQPGNKMFNLRISGLEDIRKKPELMRQDKKKNVKTKKMSISSGFNL